MGIKVEKENKKFKIFVMATLLAGACFLVYYFRHVFYKETVFTHFFYIPIILASLWWKRKGLVVAVFLAGLLILGNIFFVSTSLVVDDFFRAFMFVVVALAVSAVKDYMDKGKNKLLECEEKSFHFMESATDSFSLWDSKLNLDEINKVGLELFFPGNKKEDVIGKNILELVPGIRETGRYDKYLEAIKTGKRFFTDDIVSNFGFGDRNLAVKAFKVGDGLGVIASDITERKRFEEELRLKKEEIERWNRELTNRVEEGIKKIEEAERLALIGKLSAGIVHEINNPLYGISNYLELLSDEKEEESRKKYLNMVSHGVNIIKSITGTLLDLSQISKLNLEHVDVNDLIEDTLTFYMPDMRKSGIKVSTKFQKDIPDLPLDKSKIRQVFLNLISNAVESMPEGGNLEIRSKLIDNKLHISFADTGIGISHENLSRIFEPFFSDKRKQGRRGIGLGLFVASNIASLHKGEIQVESTVGKGSVFNVILPVNA